MKNGSVLFEGYKNTFMDGQNYSSDNEGIVLIDERGTEETKRRVMGSILES